jgi:gamma-glutamylcyclotransferase (GGCT)/AIG2-like uncharacterized protein YtfP
MTGPARIFVYGTLMPGRLRWPVLEPFAVSWRDAAVAGAIYDSGEGWPVAAFASRDDGAVPGVLVELDTARVAEALALLDEVEDTATDVLRRVEVVTADGDRAWAYHVPHPPVGLARIARWLDQTDR